MKRCWLTAGLVATAFFSLFLIGEALGLEAYLAPGGYLEHGRIAVAFVGIGLLTVDVILPVPSSLVMAVHGAFFGVWFGMYLSLAGSLGSVLIGFTIGRASRQWPLRLVSPANRAQAHRLLQKWGVLAIVITLPVPMLAETVIVLAGASGLAWWSAVLAALAGALPAALVYSLAGERGANSGTTVPTFIGLLLIAGALWLLGGRWSRSRNLEGSTK